MCCPTFPRMILHGKIYEITDSNNRDIPDAEDILGHILNEPALTTSAGSGLVTIYGFSSKDNVFSIQNVLYVPRHMEKAPVFQTKKEVFKPRPNFGEMTLYCNGDSKDYVSIKNWEYENINHELKEINAKLLISGYVDNETFKKERFVITIENSKLVKKEPWVPGGDLQGLVDKGSRDYYACQGFEELYKDGFSKEEIERVLRSR